jgi:hypothetical protein
MVSFRTTILQSGRTATGIEVPEDVVAGLGAGKRPPVTATINGHTYRSTIAPMGGVSMLSVSAAVREAAHLAAGDEVDVELELDTAPREVAVPADLAAALAVDADAQQTWDSLSYSNRSWHVLQVDGARTPETRERRIAKSIAALREGRIR